MYYYRNRAFTNGNPYCSALLPVVRFKSDICNFLGFFSMIQLGLIEQILTIAYVFQEHPQLPS